MLQKNSIVGQDKVIVGEEGIDGLVIGTYKLWFKVMVYGFGFGFLLL